MAFQSLLEDGPLARLDDGDRMVLFVLLKVYEEARQEGGQRSVFEADGEGCQTGD